MQRKIFQLNYPLLNAGDLKGKIFLCINLAIYYLWSKEEVYLELVGIFESNLLNWFGWVHYKSLKEQLDIFGAYFKNPVKQIGIDPKFLHLRGERQLKLRKRKINRLSDSNLHDGSIAVQISLWFNGPSTWTSLSFLVD